MFHNEPKITTARRPHATAKIFRTPKLASPLKISPANMQGYPFKPRIKSHLLFAGIIRGSPFSPR